MAKDQNTIEVYLEQGDKRVFAVAVDWPGWCRSARDEDSALQALCDYGPRYARALAGTSLDFHAPSDTSSLVVVERLAGDATTDFGAPSITRQSDSDTVSSAELERWDVILRACWAALDSAADAAIGQTLSTGPRGGGRELTKIVEHVRDVDIAYLRSLGGKFKLDDGVDNTQALAQIREAILTALAEAVRGEIPARGPRGGLRWTPRYFVRRLAWHELDHAWEIEDRAE
ncbi:MAG: hypothetical protein IT320_00045 [Anaerolineae bacterium]|nr:hypothetical protein [Anaerolineae bacterium]